MSHRASRRFWRAFSDLSTELQELARANFALLKADPQHPSLHFKRVGKKYWSVRVGLSYRAVGVESTEGIVWFWIGPHDEYERLIEMD